ncbi:hypothetical protein NIES4071_05950 [Calothrix sp. NIES-4071]|nr:hypothetical protein NIES4071_05950 [Calothrix sp. NIES-4071]BAZ54938.1 hypothetical protein NIES4105_05920 [Calothrix sp. NIES-4105]
MKTAIRINSDLENVKAALTEPLACVIHASDMVAHSLACYVINSDDSTCRVRSILIFGAFLIDWDTTPSFFPYHGY